MCGKSKLNPVLDEETLQMIQDSQVEADDPQLCTTVVISDRFALTAAHCQDKFQSE